MKSYLRTIGLSVLSLMLCLIMVNCSTDSGGVGDSGDTPSVVTSYKMMYGNVEIETFSTLTDFYTKYGTKLTEKEDYTVSEASKTITLTKSGYDKINGTGGGDDPVIGTSYSLKYGDTVIEKSITLDGFYSKYGAKLIESEDYSISEASKTITLTKSGYDKINGTGGGDDPKPTPGTAYDVKDLKVTETGIDSVKLQWNEPTEIYPKGYYFTVNGKKLSDVCESVYPNSNGVCTKVIKDVSWRSENGTEITVKISVSYMDYETYEYKESEGVTITAKTKPFDGTLPCYDDNNTQTISKGDTFDLKSELENTRFDIENYPDTFEFKSSDETIAAIDENGIVAGKKAGNVKIMFKDSTGCWRYIEFTITLPRAASITFVSVSATVGSVWTADNLIFTAKDPSVEVEDKDIVWTVSDSSIAEVADGKITFIKNGTVTVTVAYPDNSVSASASVTVLEKGAVTKDMMTYDESTGWYTNPEKTLRYNGKLDIETDWNKDGVWEKVLDVTHKINNAFRFDNFEATVGVNNTSSKDYSVVAEPVVFGENKVSITYTIKNIGTTKWITNFSIGNINFTSSNCTDGICSIKMEIDSLFTLAFSAEGLTVGNKCFESSLANVAKGKSTEFKAVYEIKNITGSFDAVIY